ncbi:uncharacterized protein G2W53_043858 [Senna tora]|uniref:DUF6737 domain-containing protein n=1 Tax=Senna tora TaxID=362788 RepID=A0A834SJF8_9FABA|nr:uncharacterized protein G2W53_043858 [Senna tora]
MRRLPVLALPVLALCQCHQPPTRTHFSYPILHPPLCSTLNSTKPPRKTLVFGLNSNDPKQSLFDDNGDMEGYLNQLSLEYDSVWDTKPSWCQPWTITLTGVFIVAFSWFIFHSVPVTSVIALLICAWWYIFLYSYPKAYSEMIAERREKVSNGDEDTFGRKKQ